MRTFARFIFAAALLALLPVAASAQTSAIGGTVKDTSGAVLPGVTVEASSPALIEKSAIGRHRRLGHLSDHARSGPAPTR